MSETERHASHSLVELRDMLIQLKTIAVVGLSSNPERESHGIATNAKAVWMQVGVAHEEAANAARSAGLQVVMNTCMRATHRRVVASNNKISGGG